MKKKWRILFFVIGLVGLALLVISSDPASIDWDMLLRPELAILFAGIIAIWLLIFVLLTISYKLVFVNEYKKIPFLSMLKIVVSGWALNNVTPAGLVGGEPYRIMELSRFTNTKKATSSTLTYTFLYIFGHVALLSLGCILYFIVPATNKNLVVSILMGISGVLCLAGLIWFILSRNNGFVYPFFRFLSKLPFLKKPVSKTLEKNRSFFIEIDDDIREFRSHRTHFYISLTLQLITRILEGITYFMILVFLGAKANPFTGIIVVCMASMLGNLLFFIPMQAGTRESGMAVALSHFGIEGLGVQTALIERTRELFCTLIGIILVLFEKKKKKEIAVSSSSEINK